jgi:hypothetical protein
MLTLLARGVNLGLHSGVVWLAQNLEFEVGSGARRVGTGGSGGWKQVFFDAVQTFPCSLSQRGVSADDIADHLPGGEI